MNLLAAALVDPSVAVSKATSALLAMTAFDTTNLRLTVTVPAHGKLRIRMVTTLTGATTVPTILLGVLNGATVVGRQTPLDFPGTMNAATQSCPCIADFIVTGLTPGSITLDAAYAVQVIVASTNIKYGGPNTNAGANAWGAFSFEIWDPQPMTLALDGAVNVKQWNGTNVAAPATAGIPEVNVKNIANAAAAVDANNFLKVDVEDWKGAAAPANTGDAFARLGAPAGASVSADVAAVKTDTAAVKTQTDKMAFTVANQIDANVLDWKSATAPAMTGDAFARIGAAGAGLTALGDTRIAHLDADVSSRSTYAGGAVASVTGNVGGNVVGSVGSVTAGVTLAASAIQAIWDAATSALTTVGSIGKLLVSNIDAAISSRLATSGYTTPPTVAQIRTEMDTNSTKLANLDATVSSRLATSGYTAPPTVAAIRSEIDTNSTKLDVAVSTRLASAGYTAPDNADILLIKQKTDNLPAAPAAVSDIPTAVQNADALLKRDWTLVSGEASRSALNALRFIRNKFSTVAHANQVTVFKEDDVTEAFTKNITVDATAKPITEG